MRSSLYSGQRAVPQGAAEPGDSRVQLEEGMEQENEELLNALGSAVQQVKGRAAVLLEEAQQQNQLLGLLHASFSETTLGLSRTVQRVGVVIERNGLRHTLLIAVGVFCAVVFIYNVLVW
ncbi:hypothetical protein ERJ75_000219900 [Trypanosoma vivax]|uniref:t-SNARE coiled-coil homology domain-containing protein n=1 Tax=Trypanosoma vivax (strain Y486) TaxID=1055687 RepID=G0U9N6_TRYVY|nr:hypothetical protein TRVL_03143 [Trypanosoma vivax]KAH8619049.1 hypothetical protein ERJ75_000219900 [Trypanosoma vivax]CCC52516.1 conserved hypothetical protein [Trypanosoma vivax Y486]